jgi:hypothetical protein
MPAGACALYRFLNADGRSVATDGGTASDSGVNRALVRCTTKVERARRSEQECHAGARAVDDPGLHGA